MSTLSKEDRAKPIPIGIHGPLQSLDDAMELSVCSPFGKHAEQVLHVHVALRDAASRISEPSP